MKDCIWSIRKKLFDGLNLSRWLACLCIIKHLYAVCVLQALVLAMCSGHNAVSVLIKAVHVYGPIFFIKLCIYKYYIVHSFI